jgi:F0F1-type ATP synthase assembly protein I
MVLVQCVTTLLAAALVYVYSASVAKAASLIAGATVAMLVMTYFIWRAFTQALRAISFGEPHRILGALYRAGIIKFLLAGLGLAIVFHKARGLDHAIVLAGFVLALLSGNSALAMNLASLDAQREHKRTHNEP